jgi:hypothetical protein
LHILVMWMSGIQGYNLGSKSAKEFE